ncbi:hypothetical protein CDAR_444531 [Caerostris darwini]|uniref:Serpin domain-containing protein n=1 Tax=Caerostris darwini TaxID=1538125 RepID=A0AAV4W7U4_9ARAC|nr:hypothetical protein CDAR_444531 [Caerostris darwini]
MIKTKIQVALPKFRLEYSKSLKESFQTLGMNRVFNEGAHLNEINDSKQLLVSEILHKAFLIVDEEGSEAAAVTAATVMWFHWSCVQNLLLTIHSCFQYIIARVILSFS